MSQLPPAGVGAPAAPQGAPVPPTPPAGATPVAPQGGSQEPRGEYRSEFVGKINYTSRQLFEVSGAVDITKAFPEAIAFVMFIPGIPDASKATGVTYNQDAKEIMKIGIRDLFAMAEALKMAALSGQSDFVVYTDSSKSLSNTGPGVTKQVSVGAGEWRGKSRVYLNYKGQGQIQVSLEKWHALGLANQIETLAKETLAAKFKKEKQLMFERRN